MANEEQELEITQNGEYKNINPKTLEDGNYILINKKVELEKNGKYGKFYIVIADYKEKTVSFFLSGKQGDAYKVLGNEDDTIKVTAKLQENPMKKGVFYKQFKFDLV